MWSNAGKYIRCRKRSAAEISDAGASDADTDTTAATAPYSQDDDSYDGSSDSHDSDVSNENNVIPESITPLDISRRFSTDGHLLEKTKVPLKLLGEPHRQREPKDMFAVCLWSIAFLHGHPSSHILCVFKCLHGVYNIAWRHILMSIFQDICILLRRMCKVYTSYSYCISSRHI